MTKQRTFLGHPVGLYVLFFTEMWERFSYYGMRALLLPYMLNYLKWSQQEGSTVYKVYTSFVYVTPILGGFLADRYLGNRSAVIIGAALMTVGHFLMAFEPVWIFYSALIFLIFGNGFFKPNMSTQVGRLYPAGDARRDSAYTIFYMGINLGAFLSPLIGGWLVERTMGGYHSGFTMAGIGMVLGMLIYVLGQPFIKEVQTADGGSKDPVDVGDSSVLTEEQASRAPTVLGNLSKIAYQGLLFAASIMLVLSIGLGLSGRLSFWDALMLGIGAGCTAVMAYVCQQVTGGARDRVLAILALGVFVIFFWAAFEQAGNVLNIWADKNTDRYITEAPPLPTIMPEVAEQTSPDAEAPVRLSGLERFTKMFELKPREHDPRATWTKQIQKEINPMPTAWFQSVNAVLIFVLAPVFAITWTWLERRGKQPSIPVKMILGLLLMSASMGIMVAGARQENQPTSAKLEQGSLPEGLVLSDQGQIGRRGENGKIELFHAGRLTYDEKSRTLNLQGVLSDNERDRLIEATAPKVYHEAMIALQEDSQQINDATPSVSVRLANLPPGFDLRLAGIPRSVLTFHAKQRRLTAHDILADRELHGLLVAGGAPGFRATVHELYIQSSRHRVSYWWLMWSYLFATFGELCLSPVGLSMVSKLAPAKFATMLMGVWLLMSSFGNFAAGLLGESWGTVAPIPFFMLATAIVGGASLVLYLVAKKLTHAMHGVN